MTPLTPFELVGVAALIGVCVAVLIAVFVATLGLLFFGSLWLIRNVPMLKWLSDYLEEVI